ncbi:MAG: hypothetical protein IJF69_04695 [Clostridia bacterium]|nr:hypothetical protein [Clostridia bacterium]
MRNAALFMATVLLFVCLVSCKYSDMLTQSITESSTGTETLEVSFGMRRIPAQYVTEAFYNFSDNDIREIKNTHWAIQLPDHMSKTDTEEYLRFDPFQAKAVLGFCTGKAYFVKNDFVMDDTIYLKAVGFVPENLTFDGNNTICAISTLGYEYVSYEHLYDNEFHAYVFARISNNIIITFEYIDNIQEYDYFKKCLDSIEVNVVYDIYKKPTNDDETYAFEYSPEEVFVFNTESNKYLYDISGCDFRKRIILNIPKEWATDGDEKSTSFPIDFHQKSSGTRVMRICGLYELQNGINFSSIHTYFPEYEKNKETENAASGFTLNKYSYVIYRHSGIAYICLNDKYILKLQCSDSKALLNIVDTISVK